MKFEMAEIKIEKFEIMDVITSSVVIDEGDACSNITEWS